MTMTSTENIYLRGNLLALFARTATPIVLIMTINGLYVVADAYFLGLYVGATALSAVTLIFPAMMIMYALQTLVSNGMASILARQLGAGMRDQAQKTFASAHLLAAAVASAFILLYWLIGPAVINHGAAGAPDVQHNALTFMMISVMACPISFFLSLHVDSLRCEGWLGFMTMVTVASTLLNIAFNWLFLGSLGLGVAGSALATVLAQAVCLALVFCYRLSNARALRLSRSFSLEIWKEMLALGAPTSLGLLGISLVSASVIFNVRLWSGTDYVDTVAAYGIINRIMTFAYLPLMGINIAFQTICGNNYGAGLKTRSNDSLRIALLISVLYCGLTHVLILGLSGHIGAAFVSDAHVISEVARILPCTVAAYVLFGGPIVLSGYFQSIGRAGLAGLFGLSRVYFFTLPLLFLLPHLFGERGIWIAIPSAEIAMLVLVAVSLSISAFRHNWRFGLFQPL